MRSLLENKRLIIGFSVLALGALTVLAIGLGDVPFRGATSFSRNVAGNQRQISPIRIDSVVDAPLWKQLSVWALLLLMVVLIGALLSPEFRKRLILIMIRAAVTYWALYIIFTRYRDLLIQMGTGPKAAGNSISSTLVTVPPPEFVPPQSFSLTSYLISFGVAALIVIVVWKLFNFWRENYAVNSDATLNRLAGVARSSLQDLSSGRDSTDVIMNCYFRMSDVLADKRNLHRGSSMTPTEFASRLEQAGLPADAVRRLTRLFEGVRYGGYRSGTPEVSDAVACLTTILRYCGEAV
jgi:hypothetical protein